MTIHILRCPLCGLATLPPEFIAPHEVKTIANQQQSAARIMFIFHDVEKVTGASELFSSLPSPSTNPWTFSFFDSSFSSSACTCFSSLKMLK